MISDGPLWFGVDYLLDVEGAKKQAVINLCLKLAEYGDRVFQWTSETFFDPKEWRYMGRLRAWEVRRN